MPAKKEAPIPTAISASDAQKQELVSDNANYYVTFQLGANSHWREFSGRRRKVQKEADGTTTYIHDPVLFHRAGPFPGPIVNGMIVHSNEWLRDYTRRSEKTFTGHLDRQFLVLDVEETSDIPEESKHNFGNLQSFVGVIETLVDKAFAERIGSGA